MFYWRHCALRTWWRDSTRVLESFSFEVVEGAGRDCLLLLKNVCEGGSKSFKAQSFAPSSSEVAVEQLETRRVQHNPVLMSSCSYCLFPVWTVHSTSSRERLSSHKTSFLPQIFRSSSHVKVPLRTTIPPQTTHRFLCNLPVVSHSNCVSSITSQWCPREGLTRS
jgi:hypothetical protein